MARDVAHDLEQIALGEATPTDALTIIRKYGEQDGKSVGQRLYIALKAATLRRLTSRRGDDAHAWVDVIRQSSSLLKARGEDSFGERLLVLSDMTADWARTCKLHDVKSVLARPHVGKILRTLLKAGGRTKRAEIVEGVGVGDANLSRILGTLEGLGLVSRDKLKERTVSLTPEGMRLANEAFALKPPASRKDAEPLVSRLLEDSRAKVRTANYHYTPTVMHIAQLAEPCLHLQGVTEVKGLYSGLIACRPQGGAHYETVSLSTGLEGFVHLTDTQPDVVFVAKDHALNFGTIIEAGAGKASKATAAKGRQRAGSTRG